MRLNTPLACMFCTIACGEDIRGPTSTEDVIERRLECAGGMAVDGLEGRGTGNRDMVGGESNKGAYRTCRLSVQPGKIPRKTDHAGHADDLQSPTTGCDL